MEDDAATDAADTPPAPTGAENEIVESRENEGNETKETAQTCTEKWIDEGTSLWRIYMKL